MPQAVRDALAFPLAGEPLDRLVTRGGTATIVIEQPSLPIPAATLGPRHLAIAAAADELDRLGVDQLTIVVAGGLLRRTSPREIGLLFPPEFRRRFRGRIVVHDAEAEDLVAIGDVDGIPLRVNRALVETDLVLPVTAAETVVDGGPGALLGATGPRVAASCSVTVAARSERLAGLEARARARAPASAARRGDRRIARAEPDADRRPVHRLSARRGGGRPAAPLARPLALPARTGARAPAHARTAPARADRRRVSTAARHRSRMQRRCCAARSSKGCELDAPLDAVVIGIPPTTPWMPRERPNPITAAYLGLGLALRLWRNAPLVADGGTAILVHPLPRRFPRPTQTPYRIAMFQTEEEAAQDERALNDYRAGHACHPLQPFLEMSASDAVAKRLGAVLVAGCRDAQAARQLGLVPVHGLGAALEMARGRGARRIGYLVAPPYFPVTVG